jgi:hypothetical protein
MQKVGNFDLNRANYCKNRLILKLGDLGGAEFRAPALSKVYEQDRHHHEG